jgi:hypothetical protein
MADAASRAERQALLLLFMRQWRASLIFQAKKYYNS